jgi:hypothetical protein
MPERTPNDSPTSPADGRIRPFTTPPISFPKTGKPSSAHDIKSFVRKILLASPDFPRLYADVVIASAPNSFEAKILAQSYEKIVAYTERTKLMSNLKSCTHIKVSGVRCGSPPLRGEQFCYFHQRMLRTVKDPPSRIHHQALLEDEESIQASLMEVVNALLRGTIELKRAELILRALNTAVRNIRRVKFGLHKSEMVTEIPDYPTPPLDEIDEQAAAAVARATKCAEAERARAAYLPAPRVAPVHAPTVNVGIAAPKVLSGDGSSTRPGGPEVPGRSAPPPKPAPTMPAEVTARKPSASVKEALTSAKTQAPANARKEAPRKSKTEAPKEAKECSPRRKPWVSTTNNEEQAPKGRRKLAGRRLSRTGGLGLT